MNSGKQDVKGSWGQEIKKPRAQDFSKDWFPDFKTSWGPDIKNSWGLEFLTSGAHESKSSWFWDIRGSWRLEIKTPRRQDFNSYWFPDITISWWIEFKSYSSRFSAVLFPMSASGTGGSPLQIGRRTSGNGTWYSTRFWVPGTWYVSGLSKLCFPLREIDFVTENSLPARGWRTPPKSSFFTGHPVCRDQILTTEGFSTPSDQKWIPCKA